jgi:hypothetical protein
MTTNKYRMLFQKIDDDVITLQGTPCIKKFVTSINVKLKLKIDLFLLFFQNSTVYDLSKLLRYFCPSLYNKNEMMFLGKRIT